MNVKELKYRIKREKMHTNGINTEDKYEKWGKMAGVLSEKYRKKMGKRQVQKMKKWGITTMIGQEENKRTYINRIT